MLHGSIEPMTIDQYNPGYKYTLYNTGYKYTLYNTGYKDPHTACTGYTEDPNWDDSQYCQSELSLLD